MCGSESVSNGRYLKALKGYLGRRSEAHPGQEVAAHRRLQPALKLPLKKWRDLILRVWHVDPLR